MVTLLVTACVTYLYVCADSILFVIHCRSRSYYVAVVCVFANIYLFVLFISIIIFSINTNNL